MAAQRKTLRNAARAQQKRNSRKIRRGAGTRLAAELRRGPRPAARGRPAQPAFRRALRLRSRRRTAPHRIARTDDRTHPALLALRRLPVADAVRQPAGRRTRQFAARRHQASQRNPRRPDRRAQPADGRTLCLRVRRRAASRTRLLSRRPRRDPPPSPRPSPDRAAPADGAKKRGRISAKSGSFPIYIPYNSPAIRRTAAPARA